MRDDITALRALGLAVSEGYATLDVKPTAIEGSSHEVPCGPLQHCGVAMRW
jgi:hypothetical protein